MKIPASWTFEAEEIARGFDRHVREQLPWYDLATNAVAHIGRHYIPRNGLVYDIGASTGNIGRACESIIDERQARLVSIEASAEMAALYNGPQRGNLVIADALRHEYEPFDFAACFLTLMFMPVKERAGFLARLRSLVRPGGAIVIVDKAEASSGYAATVLWRMTLAGKIAAGCDPADIVAKELSLSGVQRPVDLAIFGADAIQFFRFGEFVGYLIQHKDMS